MRRVSRTFLWQDIGTFSATEETFCGICEAHVNASNLNATEVFQKFFDPVTNKYAQQKIAKSVTSPHVAPGYYRE
jgi:hypothetical protein